MNIGGWINADGRIRVVATTIYMHGQGGSPIASVTDIWEGKLDYALTERSNNIGAVEVGVIWNEARWFHRWVHIGPDWEAYWEWQQPRLVPSCSHRTTRAKHECLGSYCTSFSCHHLALRTVASVPLSRYPYHCQTMSGSTGGRSLYPQPVTHITVFFGGHGARPEIETMAGEDILSRSFLASN